MLRKSQEDPIQSTNRNKLPLETGIRSLAGIKELLALAEASKGSQIELSWTTKNPDQVFVLDVQWDSHQKEPFWSLYEENANQSKRHWAQPFSVDNMELFYDVLVMSCGAVDPSKNLAEILKVKPEKEESSKTANKNAVNPNSEPASAQTDSPSTQPAVVNTDANLAGNQVAAPAQNQVTNPNPAAVSPPSGVNPNVVAIPAFDPNAGFMPAYPFPPGTGMPMPGYNMPPNMQPIPMPMPVPMPYPPNQGNPQPGFPGMPQWQYSPLPGGNNPYLQEPFTPGQPGSGSINTMPFDARLLDKQSDDVALLDLLIRAELLTEPDLAAALKMQELVRGKKISVEKATEVLKIFHSKGNAIGEYIASSVRSSSANLKSSKASAPIEQKAKPVGQEPMAAFELLIKASLLSPDDIKMAQGVSRKHGGDLISILEAAKKLDTNTLEAAKICHALEKDGLMKLEKCVMVLNYCSRSRVTFDEALSELNWENPRRLQK